MLMHSTASLGTLTAPLPTLLSFEVLNVSFGPFFVQAVTIADRQKQCCGFRDRIESPNC